MNIVFYHSHQNGDTFTSRLFVKHFIENTKDRGYEYFYTSENSLESHCDDIGYQMKISTSLSHLS